MPMPIAGAAFGCVALLSSLVSAATWHVSRNGDDTGPGSADRPFRTLQKAADKAAAGDTCRIGAGTYRETVRPARSGEPGRPIVFQPAGNGQVVVSGADRLEEAWTLHKGRIFKTTMAWTLGPGRDMIFVDGKVVVQARHPNIHTSGKALPRPTLPLSPLFPHAFGPFRVTKGSNAVTNPVDLKQGGADFWKGALYAGMHAWNWNMQSADVAGSAAGRIEVSNPTGRWWFPDDADNATWNHLYADNHQGFLTGTLNALDTAGEWHWQDHGLFLWTREGDSPAGRLVEAKRRHLAFDLRGRSHIHLIGLHVFAASLNLYDADSCLVDRCRISYLSHFSRWDDALAGFIDGAQAPKGPQSPPYAGEVGVVVGGNGNRILNSQIEYSAGAGLYLTGTSTTVDNCIIRDCSYAGTYLANITVYQDYLAPGRPRGGHAITRNTLFNAGRSLINVIGTGVSPDFLPMDIGYNRLHDGCLVTNDCGLFYSYLAAMGQGGRRTQLHHNLAWDQWSTFWSALLFADQVSSGLDIHHNLTWYSPANPYAINSTAFVKLNKAPDTREFENRSKTAYCGGVAGLAAADYPGGIFRTGAELQLPETRIEDAPTPTSPRPRTAGMRAPVRVLPGAHGLDIRVTEAGPHLVEVVDLDGKRRWIRSGKGPAEYRVPRILFRPGIHLVRFAGGNPPQVRIGVKTALP